MSKSSEDLYIGVDLGSTSVNVALWRVGGEENDAEKVGETRWQTDRAGPEPNIRKMVDSGRRLLEVHAEPEESLRAIGISAGGPLDPERGVVLSVPNLEGWDDVPLAAALAEGLGAPARLENDANAGAVVNRVL